MTVDESLIFAPVVLVSGATGTGKSAFALKLATELNGEIINIDSVQIYRGMDIGSAKLRAEEREGIAHHLIDVREPDERFDVVEYVQLAIAAIRDIQSRGKLAVIVGGTTMYVTALFHGLADLPKADERLRAEYNLLLNQELFERLQRRDPKSAQRLHLNDRVRVVRALETAELSEMCASEVRAEHGFRASLLRGVMLVLHRERDELYRDLNERAKLMVENGLLEEVAKLIERFGDEIRPLATIGYRESVMCLRGELEREKLSDEIALNTRHLAKRQMTYWRNEPAKRGWREINCTRQDPSLLANLLKILSNTEIQREVWHLM